MKKSTIHKALNYTGAVTIVAILMTMILWVANYCCGVVGAVIVGVVNAASAIYAFCESRHGLYEIDGEYIVK